MNDQLKLSQSWQWELLFSCHQHLVHTRSVTQKEVQNMGKGKGSGGGGNQPAGGDVSRFCLEFLKFE